MPDLYDPSSAQMSKQSAIERLADFITDFAARTNKQLWCYSNNVAPNPNNTLANFVEATFGGYARATGLAFTNNGVDQNANAYATSAIVAYSCNGVTSGSVYGTILVATPAGAVNATATAVGGNAGAYGGITITNPGAAYTAAPKVTPTGATGTGFAATSVINASGQVTAIDVTNAGTGYTTYTLTLDPPLELIKQNVLNNGQAINMALSTDVLPTYCQLIEPSNPS